MSGNAKRISSERIYEGRRINVRRDVFRGIRDGAITDGKTVIGLALSGSAFGRGRAPGSGQNPEKDQNPEKSA